MDSLMPEYLRIEKDLRERIECGELEVGEKLPREEALAARYSVSRTTLRKALSLLAEEGHIIKITGKGSFVTSPGDKSIEDMKARRNGVMKLNRAIGVLIPCVTASLYAGLVRGVEDACRENGYYLVLGNYDARPEKEQEYMETFMAKGVSGLIVAPSYNSYLNPCYETLQARGIPFVLAGNTVDGIDVDIVASDNVGGGYRGTEHLVSSGCRKIAFVCSRFKSRASMERLLGYIQALREAGIPVRDGLIHEINFAEEPDNEKATLFFSRDRCDGIFSANESTTLGILNALDASGAGEEDRREMVCFDKPNLPPVNRPLSFVIQPAYEIGRMSVKLLLERLKERKGDRTPPRRKILLQPRFIEGYRNGDLSKLVSLAAAGAVRYEI